MFLLFPERMINDYFDAGVVAAAGVAVAAGAVVVVVDAIMAWSGAGVTGAGAAACCFWHPTNAAAASIRTNSAFFILYTSFF